MKTPYVPFLALLFALIVLPNLAHGQVPDLQEVNEIRIRTAKIGMYTLGGWALANMAVSGIGLARSTGQTKAFHQMNVFWNVVNLGIAAGSYYGMAADDPMGWTAWESLDHQLLLEKAFLFNAALDLAYMTGGLYLRERAKSDPGRAYRWRGWGNSILLQGGFLFAFDLAMYFIVHPGLQDLQPFLSQVAVSPAGFSVVIPLGR